MEQLLTIVFTIVDSVIPWNKWWVGGKMLQQLGTFLCQYFETSDLFQVYLVYIAGLTELCWLTFWMT